MLQLEHLRQWISSVSPAQARRVFSG
jgi:hypothetical protein